MSARDDYPFLAGQAEYWAADAEFNRALDEIDHLRHALCMATLTDVQCRATLRLRCTPSPWSEADVAAMRAAITTWGAAA